MNIVAKAAHKVLMKLISGGWQEPVGVNMGNPQNNNPLNMRLTPNFIFAKNHFN